MFLARNRFELPLLCRHPKIYRRPGSGAPSDHLWRRRQVSEISTYIEDVVQANLLAMSVERLHGEAIILPAGKESR